MHTTNATCCLQTLSMHTRGYKPTFCFGKARGPPTTPPRPIYEQHVQQVRPGAAQCSSIESCLCRVFTALRPPPTPHAPPHAPPSRSATGRLPTSGVLDRCHNGAPNSPASQHTVVFSRTLLTSFEPLVSSHWRRTPSPHFTDTSATAASPWYPSPRAYSKANDGE